MKRQTKTEGWSATLLRETLKKYYPETYRKLVFERKLEPLLYKNQDKYMEAIRVSILRGVDELAAMELHREVLMQLPYNLDNKAAGSEAVSRLNLLGNEHFDAGPQSAEHTSSCEDKLTA